MSTTPTVNHFSHRLSVLQSCSVSSDPLMLPVRFSSYPCTVRVWLIMGPRCIPHDKRTHFAISFDFFGAGPGLDSVISPCTPLEALAFSHLGILQCVHIHWLLSLFDT